MDRVSRQSIRVSIVTRNTHDASMYPFTTAFLRLACPIKHSNVQEQEKPPVDLDHGEQTPSWSTRRSGDHIARIASTRNFSLQRLEVRDIQRKAGQEELEGRTTWQTK